MPRLVRPEDVRSKETGPQCFPRKTHCLKRAQQERNTARNTQAQKVGGFTHRAFLCSLAIRSPLPSHSLQELSAS